MLVCAILLGIRVPESMREAVREHFPAELQADAGRHADPPAQGDASSQEHAEATRRAVEARARVMLDTAAVTILVAIWWITVALPIPATSLVPLLLLPLVGALPMAVVARAYADRSVFLFMGGFILALAIERWGLHRRIALHVVAAVGTQRRRLVLGFMIASALVSMWISNSATAMMLFPIALAVISALPREATAEGPADREHANFAAGLMLAVAYGASIGGIATPIGTPPNIVFLGQYHQLFPHAREISFVQWMVLWVPVVVAFIPLAWLVLTRITCRVGPSASTAGRDLISKQLRQLGRMKRPEALVLIAFVTAALLWITRSIPISDGANYGWASLLAQGLRWFGDGEPRIRADQIDDASVAIGIAFLLFIVPGDRDARGRRVPLMDWTTAQRLPWGILLLFGGGFAIAAGFEQSGLSYWLGRQLAGLGLTSPLLLVIAMCALVTFVTELTSNTATAQVMLPIAARLSLAVGVDPLLLMLPATIAASLGFMMPVGTPPNAIVFGSGHVPMKHMVRSGLILNILGIVLVTAAMFLIARPMLGLR